MQQIAPERRSAIALVAIDGFAYADAANLLGIPVGTLMSRIARGRGVASNPGPAHLADGLPQR
jgi:RNA polymerase sigma-70 factor, ECF subfamily